MNELTKEDLEQYKKYGCYLSVGLLKKIIEDNNYPDDALIMIQKVDYDNGRGVYLKSGEQTLNWIEHNRKVESGEYLNKEEYPNMTEEWNTLVTQEELKQTMEVYSPAFCVCQYKDDKDILFIDLDY